MFLHVVAFVSVHMYVCMYVCMCDGWIVPIYILKLVRLFEQVQYIWTMVAAHVRTAANATGHVGIAVIL